MTGKIRFFGAAAIALAAAAPAAHAANLLTNGNFEAGPTGATVPGWTIDFISDSNSVLVLKGGDYGLCCSATGSPAALANQFVSFGAGDSPNFPARIYQDYAATGGLKRLEFDYGAIGGTHSLNFGILDRNDPNAQFFVLVGSVNANATNNFDNVFTHFTVDYVSAGGAESIQFASFDGTDSKDFFLDNVSIVSIAAVPEPASWALMIAGFGLVGSAMRRRQSVRVTYA